MSCTTKFYPGPSDQLSEVGEYLLKINKILSKYSVSHNKTEKSIDAIGDVLILIMKRSFKKVY